MKPRFFQRQGFKFSLALHGTVLVLMLVSPLIIRACNRNKPNEQLMFVDFTVSIPPPSAPDIPTPPTPEPPKPPPSPEDIVMPDKKPELKPVEAPKPKDIRQTNRVTRKDFKGPIPKDKPLSEAEIARRLLQGARISDTTSIPDEGQISLGAYYNYVTTNMYNAWQLPPQLANLPGLSADVRITVEPGGAITARTKIRGSGNDLMDDSVMKAVNSVKVLRPLPVGHRRPVDIDITFIPE